MVSAQTTSAPVAPVMFTDAHISWGAIFAGALASIGVWILLYVAGLALGLSAIDPNDLDSARAAGIGTGVWSILAPLIALFIGGLIVGRAANLDRSIDGVIHATVMWSLTNVVGFLIIGMLASAIATGAMRTASGAAQAAVSAAQSQGGGQGGGEGGVLQALGLKSDDLLAPVNARLRAEGKPEVTASQLQAAMQEATRTAVRTGEIDRDAVATALASQTALTRQDAEQIAARVESRFEEQKQNAATMAAKAADTTGKIFWALAGALALGLAAAILGAWASVNRRRKGFTRRVEEARRNDEGGTYVPAHGAAG